MNPHIENGMLIFNNWYVGENGILMPDYKAQDIEFKDYLVNAQSAETLHEFVDKARLLLNEKYKTSSNIEDVCLIIDEAVNNHAKHSLTDRLNNKIHAYFFMLPDSLATVVESVGKKFDPQKAIESYKTATDPFLLKDSGRGLFLMSTYSDKFIIIFDEVQKNDKDYMTQTAFKKKML